MNSSISLPDPGRQRRLPSRFSWLDHRLLREGYLAACASPEALALYLILCSAADARGLSYYSEKRLSALLAISGSQLKAARRCLVNNDLIAWRPPHYQVLCLDPETIRQSRLRNPALAGRSAQPMSLKQVFQQLANTSTTRDDDA